MLNIFYGREDLDKEKFIFDHMAERALIMVPDQYTLEAERQAFRHLGISALMDVEVVSPSSLGENILGELGGSRRAFINKYGRHMILYKSAAALSEKLRVFRGMEDKPAFIDEVNNFISEMKQYGCGPEDLTQMASREDCDPYTRRKLLDMYDLFSDYEKQIEGRYTDSEDRVDLYLHKIKDSALVRGNTIWVYGFDSFAPKTLALLGELMSAAKDVNVVLTWDGSGKDADLFELTGIVAANLCSEADSRGVLWNRQPVGSGYRLSDVQDAVRHIEKELYATPPAADSCHDGITLVEAANVYNEAESAAAFVLGLVRDRGFRYKDIRLVCNDMDGRRAVIEKVFEEYGIEVFSDIKRDITDSPAIRAVSALTDICAAGLTTEKLLSLLKSGFGDLTAEETAVVENYAIKYKIKGYMWKSPFRRGIEEYGEDGLKTINDLREKAVAPILSLEKIRGKKTTGEFIEQFYSYLRGDMKMREKIGDFIAGLEEKELFEEADEMALVWDSFLSVLDQIYEIMGQEPFDAGLFNDILMTGLGQVEIGLLPPTEDGLILGNIQRSRTGRVRALVVLGANEGLLPREKPTEGLFSAEEREMFRDSGKELCKVDQIRFMEEKLAIYRTFSRADEILWMSCSLSDTEGNQLRPSHIFTRMKELFPNAEVQKDVLNRENRDELISGGISGLRHLGTILRESAGEEAAAGKAGRGISDRWKQAISWILENRPEEMARIRDSLFFTNKQDALGKEAAEALFMGDTGTALRLSPSRIETFSRCPFSHFVTYGLRPEERRVFEASSREIGDVYHRCLMKLTQELTVKGKDVTDPASPWMTVTKEECADLVRREIEAIAGEYREGLFNAGAVENYRRERLIEVCSQVCYAVVEQVRKGRIKTILPEAFFGRRGVLPPVETDVDGRKVYIEGIIDRVDYLEDGRVKIVDYKTGNENFDINEARTGYRLQLMIYLQAACQKGARPAGVFYFLIKDHQINMTEMDIDSQTVEDKIRKNFRMNGIMVDDEEVIEEIAGRFTGSSDVVQIRNTKDGIKSAGKETLVAEDEFAGLQADVEDKVKELCEDILAGRIDIHPMKTRDTSACAFCRYRGICRFDTVFEGCSYNIIS